MPTPLERAFEIINESKELTSEEIAEIVSEQHRNHAVKPYLKLCIEAIQTSGFKIIKIK